MSDPLRISRRLTHSGKRTGGHVCRACANTGLCLSGAWAGDRRIALASPNMCKNHILIGGMSAVWSSRPCCGGGKDCRTEFVRMVSSIFTYLSNISLAAIKHSNARHTVEHSQVPLGTASRVSPASYR